MKKLFVVLLTVLMFISFSACGKTAEEPGTEIIPPTPAEKIEEPENPAAEPEPAEEPEVSEEEQPVFDEELFKAAKALEGESAEDLFAAIGEPVSAEEYTSSCMGPGEDGLFHYPGFSVYTYREGKEESVVQVLED